MTRLLPVRAVAVRAGCWRSRRNASCPYDSTVAVNADGSMDVTETIKVHAEGKATSAAASTAISPPATAIAPATGWWSTTLVSVLRDGNAEPWFTERMANGVRLNTGNDDPLPVPADYTYTLRYRTTRQLGFFKDHDELYWNAIGTGWGIPDRIGQRRRAPAARGADRCDACRGVHRRAGRAGPDYAASLPAPGEAHWQLTRPLAPRRPDHRARFPGHRRRAVAGAAPVVAAGTTAACWSRWPRCWACAYAFRRWRQVGRDPKPGIVIARYEPPKDYSPVALRFIQKMGGDNRCVTSDLLSLAVVGCLRIERDKGLLADKWSLQRTGDGAHAALSASQRALLAGLFKDGHVLELDKDNATLLQAAIGAQKKVLEDAYAGRRHVPAQPRQRRHRRADRPGRHRARVRVVGGGGIPPIVAIGVLAVAALIAFAIPLCARTPEGRKLLDEIAGPAYLVSPNATKLAHLYGPTRRRCADAERYQFLLSHAVALEVEEA